MRPIVLTRAGSSGTSVMGVLDTYRSPFNVGVGVVISGAATATIEHTFDNVLAEGVTPTWFPHVDLASMTASVDGNYAFPVRAVRVNMSSGTGSVVATFIQAGMPGD